MDNNTGAIDRRKFLTMSSVALMAGAVQPILGNRAQAKSDYGIEGYMAPEISLDYWIDQDGKPTTYSVEAQRGKWVFLKCFQNWCPGCHSSGFPALQKFSSAFADHPEVSIAAVQTVFEGFRTNNQAAVRELQLRYDLPIPMGHDPGNPDGDHRPQTMVNYRTGGTPWIIIIEPGGSVVFNDFHINVDALIDYVGERVA